VVVSDASTDGTDALVRQFAEQHAFIELVRREDSTRRDFASQVFAQRFGCECLEKQKTQCDFIGMLDADISLAPDYYERVLEKFENNPKLGIAGGFIQENVGRGFRDRKTNAGHSVAGGIQMFRQECFAAIGGYVPLKWGGMDTVAEIMARMRGWEVEAFPDLKACHHKAGESWRWGTLRRCLIEGRMDRSLGVPLSVEFIKCAKRVLVQPYLLGSLFRWASYISATLTRDPYAVQSEIMDFHRSQYQQRIKRFAHLGRSKPMLQKRFKK
jgi:glycosyltransferase involved in cell wall biosynthesis